jgi:hypothetical protein
MTGFFLRECRRPAFDLVARRFFLCVCAILLFFLLFAGLPAAHEIIMGVGFLRFAVECFARERRRRFGGAATARLRLRGGFGRVRARCLGRDRLAFSAAFWRGVPKNLICFALNLRRLLAMFRFFPFPARRAGF